MVRPRVYQVAMLRYDRRGCRMKMGFKNLELFLCEPIFAIVQNSITLSCRAFSNEMVALRGNE